MALERQGPHVGARYRFPSPLVKIGKRRSRPVPALLFRSYNRLERRRI